MQLSPTSSKNNSGFTLIEMLISASLFVVIGTSTYFAFQNVLEAISRSQVRSDAIALVKGEIETVRNMPYVDVGILGGYPAGKLAASKDLSYESNTFALTTTVRNIDDPFDGTLGGSPNDTAPADYKIVEFEIACTTCGTFVPIAMTTTISAKGLESASTNGSLFINVFDASGAPVPNANVHVVNTALSPDIPIDDETNNDGALQLVDIPPSVNGYEITVTKAGYSTDGTADLDVPGNPSPLQPHATVATQQVTSVSFFIDRTGTVNVLATDAQCAPIPGLGFALSGSKLIGVNPDVLKYPATTFTTDSAGRKTISNLEWDSYSVASVGSLEFTGIMPFMPFVLNPASTVDVRLLFEPKVPKSLMVTVVDNIGQPVDHAIVRLVKTGSYDQTRYTARRTIGQTDWGGANYDSQSGNVGYSSPTTELQIQAAGGGATSSEWLISNTYDMGSANTTFYHLRFDAQLQPAHPSPDAVRIQIATNNDNATWNFVGPDGTEGTYFTASNTLLPTSLDGRRYLKYKIYFYLDGETTVTSFKDIAIDFNASCTPTGQALFNDLGPGTHTITVSKTGFQTFADEAVSISGDWQQYKATLTP
ncbi:hypothetical protein A2333_02835 [Candidatus Wolfebacteria bacterium RIFOXYB2_FULL_49_7]|nr:MAG: hypothetical protein A2333_02835 [Candidatus Wolfebacteria bacterium RIFOXYB2_FULL_49_7]